MQMPRNYSLEQKARLAAQKRARYARDPSRYQVQAYAWRARNPNYRQTWSQTPRGRYDNHKQRAAKRGIAFLLTFDEWWSIWDASGHWNERGNRFQNSVIGRAAMRRGRSSSDMLAGLKCNLLCTPCSPTRSRSRFHRAWPWAARA